MKTDFREFFRKNDQWLTLAIFVWSVLFWILNLAAVLSPWHAQIIIEAGLTPFLIVFIAEMASYIGMGYWSKILDWKSLEFWIPVVAIGVLLIGLGLCWGEIAPHYEALANHFQVVNNQPQTTGNTVLTAPQTPASRLLCAAQWISVILIALTCAGWWWIFFRAYRAHNWNDRQTVSQEPTNAEK